MRESLLPLLLAGFLAPTGWMPAMPQGCPTPSFSTATPVTVGDNPYAVTTGDFDRDGKADLAVANTSANTVWILPGDGSGGFSAGASIAVGISPGEIITGDFNSDGKTDLATVNANSDNVSVLLGDGTGGFGTATNFAVGDVPLGLTAGDFNGDGKTDLAVANRGPDNVSVLLGDDSGGFAAASNFAAGDGPDALVTGDFNRDGSLDLAVANEYSDKVSVLLGTGTGSFAAPLSYDVGDLPLSVATGDFNRDGYPDLAVANQGTNNVSILAGDGLGGFGTATPYAAGTLLSRVTTGDFTGDGKTDLAVSNLSAATVSVLPGDGSGGFGTASPFAVGSGPLTMAPGDFNSDGKPDLAVASSTADRVSVLLNTCTLFSCVNTSFTAATPYGAGDVPIAVTAGDFNRDGKTDLAVANWETDNVSVLPGDGSGGFGTATPFAAGNAPATITTADFNRDGIADLATGNFLSHNVTVLLGTGGGGFGAPVAFAVGDDPNQVITGDFNRDGKPDLAVALSNTDNVLVLPGNGSGGFGAPVPFTVGDGPYAIVTGDFNRDGVADLATANIFSHNVSVLPGNGLGGFGTATSFSVGTNPNSITTGDFNRDGKPDLAASSTTFGFIYVLLGDGSGGFGTATPFGSGGGPKSLITADFNKDGKADLATANVTSDQVAVLPGNGSGGFGAPTPFTVGDGPESVTTGDFNGDGKPDLASANQYTDNASVLINNCTWAVAPVITCPANKTANVGSNCEASVSFEATATGVPAPVITYAIGTTVITSPHSFPRGETTVTAKATNSAGEVSCTFTVTVNDNVAPTFTSATATPAMLAPPNHKMREISLAYLATDNCPGNITYSIVSVTSNEPDDGEGDGDRPGDIVIDGNTLQLRAERSGTGTGRIYTVTVKAADATGNFTTQTIPVVVAHNISAPVSGASFKVGSTVSFTGTFWDIPGNQHTAKWLIDGSTSVKGVVTEPSGLKNGKVTGSYRFNTPGVYKLQMNVTDQYGVTTYANTAGDLEAIVVIYDPKGGHTYGGGWFASPAGALASDAAARGKVSYGYAVNYFKTATYPKGETQFELKAGELEYNALNFDYLAIAGAKAQFKGSGKIIGGQSGIDFVMTVIDGALDGTGTDKVRIRIYNKNTGYVYYDNEPGASEAGDPITPTGSNSTVVISGGVVTTRTAPADGVGEAPEGLEVGVLPNPTRDGFNVRIRSDNKNDRITLQVLDQNGRLLETRNVSGELTPGLGSHYRPGTYYIRVVQGKEHKEVKVIKLQE